MALFRRKREQDVLPDEVKEYYKAEQRDRMGMAWLVAAGGFLITVAIVLGLFFAGRWAYTTFFSDDDTTTTEVEEADVPEQTELPSFTNGSDEETTDENEASEQETESDSDNDSSDREAIDEEALPRTGPIAE